MSLLTENDVRNRIKGEGIKELVIDKGVIVTPSARTYLIENNIKLKVRENEEKTSASEDSEIREWKKPKEAQALNVTDKKDKIVTRYVTEEGAFLEEKPEHMTSLYGNVLVFKDHKRIIFRGKVDSLECQIVMAQVNMQKLGLTKLVDDLQEVLDYVRSIIRCEVLGEELKDTELLGMDSDKLREVSHNPKKYYGIGHFFPDYKMGEAVASINILRAATREVELAAYSAFKMPNGKTERDDIIKGLNRLSSLYWIMAFKYLTGEYK